MRRSHERSGEPSDTTSPTTSIVTTGVMGSVDVTLNVSENTPATGRMPMLSRSQISWGAQNEWESRSLST